MVAISKVVFKRITASDFYYINQPGLSGGGGQSYIDFDTSDISYEDWSSFFASINEHVATGGPFWTFGVRNLGSDTLQQNVKIGQRRATSFSIRSQKLPEHSLGGRRLHAWSPKLTGFPELPGGITSAEQVPSGLIAGLTIFLIRDADGKFWAGWTHDVSNGLSDKRLVRMFSEKAGIIDLEGGYVIDGEKPNWPFGLVDSDTATVDLEDWLEEDELDIPETGIVYAISEIRKRNRKAANKVKKLYSTCQLTGDEFIFETKKGLPYLEVHHLVPLGRGGADSPHNMVVVSAHVHRMLHYAKVSNIDLSAIKNNKLALTINGHEFVITWAPKHAEVVTQYNPASTA